MEVKIGIQHVAREVVVEVKEDAAAVTKLVDTALKEGTALSLTDNNGRTVLVRGEAIAYVDLGADNHHPVGFGVA